ncbi:MAG: hypothetical protein PQJ50_10315 [Spirochaetales bacterium]|nr:hypothetical protein [Spirochaetales bacterium]
MMHTKTYRIRITILLLILLPVFSAAGSPFSLDLDVEFGFTGIIKHEIQSGTTGDKGDIFNYKTQGGQDILFPFSRFQADLEILERHHAVFLYQPLTIETTAVIDEDFRFNGQNFTTTDGELTLLYSFDFWRFSYLYDVIEAPGFFLSPGISFQIRNARIIFKSEENMSIQSDIGPVPILKLRTGYQWDNGAYVMFEGDGFYASNKFFNGADYPFTGYIYDLSLRGGYRFNKQFSSYLNLRFLGGGAEGTNDNDEYTYNDLHTFSVTIGATLHL